MALDHKLLQNIAILDSCSISLKKIAPQKKIPGFFSKKKTVDLSMWDFTSVNTSVGPPFQPFASWSVARRATQPPPDEWFARIHHWKKQGCRFGPESSHQTPGFTWIFRSGRLYHLWRPCFLQNVFWDISATLKFNFSGVWIFFLILVWTRFLFNLKMKRFLLRSLEEIYDPWNFWGKIHGIFGGGYLSTKFWQKVLGLFQG